MEIVESKIGKGCGKVEFNTVCGSYSLKHKEYYYCSKCYKKQFKEKIEDGN